MEGVKGDVVMLSEDELRRLIEHERDVHFCIVDLDARSKHEQYILGLVTVLNE